MKILKILITTALLVSNVFGQADTLRVATYNMLQFQHRGALDRAEYFRTVIDAIDPDIFVAQEIGSEFYAEFIHEEIFDTDEFGMAEFIDGPDSDNIMIYKLDKIEPLDVLIVGTPLRNITVYPVRLVDNDRTPILYIGVAHLQGSSGGANEQRRLEEITEFIEFMDEEDLYDDHVLFAGDFNVYESAEPAYQMLLENDRFYDPIETPGDWHDNAEFSHVHTQSPRTDQFDGGAHGGIDDRFDHIMATQPMRTEEGWYCLPETYTSFGNDGQRLNGAVNRPRNQAVSEEIADALHEASDHLPVFMDIVAVTPEEPFEFEITLQEGWNLISSVSQPEEANMMHVWADIVERDHLDIVKDQLGHFYVPAHHFNNITDWNVLQGYQVKMTGDDVLTIRNESINPETEIPLRSGWSIVSYLPEEEIEAPAAFANLPDGMLLLAKDLLGHFYAPEHNFSNMGNLRRGQGYQVKSSEATDLIWNIPEQLNSNTTPMPYRTTTGCFPTVSPTSENMSLLVDLTGIDFPLSTIKEVGIFTSEHLCVGSCVVNSESKVGIAIWGDDPTTFKIEGAKESESLIVNLWDGNQNIRAMYDKGLRYNQDQLKVIDIASDFIPEAIHLHALYPNPFNDQLHVSISLPDRNQVNLAMFDIHGRKIKTIVSEPVNAGFHSYTLKAHGLSSGIYFVTLQVDNIRFSRKVALLQ